MELLFRREQTAGRIGRVNFKLWGKIELDADEQAIVKRYKFDESVLIEAIQPTLIRNAILIALGGMVIGVAILALLIGTTIGTVFGIAAGLAGGYWYFHQKRETIFVRDLLHGRNFSCASVVELARKEAWLAYVVSFLRQVMESAKHWDGTERHTVEPLPKDEARQVIIRGL